MTDRWATFDRYGTLADWTGGMTRAVEPFAGAAAGRLMDAYFALEPEVERAPRDGGSGFSPTATTTRSP